MRAAIQHNDTVWYIGANIGYYTTRFLEWTGPAGKVVAFEPLPAAFNALKNSVDNALYASGRYLLHQAAITYHYGNVCFTTYDTGDDSVTTISHIADVPNGPEDYNENVRAFRVDSVVENSKRHPQA